MKKTLIALIALAGVAMGDTYNYIGESTTGNQGWFESRKNWQNTDTSQVMGSGSGDMSDAEVDNVFIIANGKTVTAGTGAHSLTGADITVIGSNSVLKTPNAVSGATLSAEDGGSIQASRAVTDSTLSAVGGGSIQLNCTSNTSYTNLNITVDADSSLSFGKDAKLSNVVITSEGAVTFAESWIDASFGNVTYDLGSTGMVTYEKLNYNSDGYTNTLTLNADCQNGFLNGSGDILVMERTLISISAIQCQGGTQAKFLTECVESSITLNDKELNNASFDRAALSAEDVGKYQLVFTDDAIKVQYVAYTNAIPEPTTATLSLLALAGLAARRRRR